LSSAGYDVRLDTKFKIFTNINSCLIDPLNFDEKSLVDVEGDSIIIPPNSYALGLTVEEFDIPEDVLVIVIGKSTYARAGASINCTPIEPGFKGKVVIEISNSTPLPLKVYANMGIAQFVFLKASKSCKVSYADKNGKYQNQNTIVTPLV
jgi:dCTP deaminase